MKSKPPITFEEHQRRAAKSRWKRMTAAERSAYAKMMVAAREAKKSQSQRAS